MLGPVSSAQGMSETRRGCTRERGILTAQGTRGFRPTHGVEKSGAAAASITTLRDMSEQTRPATTAISVPPWLWGGNPAGLFQSAQLRAKALPSLPDTWRVQTEEAYFRRRPGLVSVEHLAGPSSHRRRFGVLRELAMDEAVNDGYDRGMSALKKRASRADKTGEPVDFLSTWQLWTMIARPDELVSAVTQVHNAMRKVTVAGEPRELVFMNCGVHLVRRSRALVHRAKLVSVLVRLAYDTRLRSGDLSHLQRATESQELVFSSADELHNGVLLFDAYMGPIYGALTPAIWCLPIHRELGGVIYSLGQSLTGTRGDAAELLQLLPSPGVTTAIENPTISPKASGAALDWWSAQLDKLFAVVTDPAVFSDKTGNFQPVDNLRALLSVEQLFRRVSSIQLTHRDINAQRVLLFTVLDTLQRLTGLDIETHCSLRIAQKTLEHLRVSIPEDAAEILLPGAERAVAALAAVQDGFFLQRQMGVDVIEIPSENGQVKQLDPEQAAAHYIKMLRDATHGHGSNRAGRVERVNALLAHHSGHMPFDLPLLGYLYLLSLLVRPEVLRKRLAYSSG